jgi:hypothetical protein
MLTLQMKADLLKVIWTWKRPASPFTGLLGRTMEAQLHYQPRLKVLYGFSLINSMRTGQRRVFARSESNQDKGFINFSMSKC